MKHQYFIMKNLRITDQKFSWNISYYMNVLIRLKAQRNFFL